MFLSSINDCIETNGHSNSGTSVINPIKRPTSTSSRSTTQSHQAVAAGAVAGVASPIVDLREIITMSSLNNNLNRPEWLTIDYKCSSCHVSRYYTPIIALVGLPRVLVCSYRV